MRHLRIILFLITLMVIFSNCTFQNNKVSKQVNFGQLDKNIQDTLQSFPEIAITTFTKTVQDTLTDGTVLSRDTVIALHAIDNSFPDVISFDGQFEIIYKEWGPWILWKKLKDIENGRTYYFHFNTPTPFIITSDEIIYPADYTYTYNFKEVKYNIIQR